MWDTKIHTKEKCAVYLVSQHTSHILKEMQVIVVQCQSIHSARVFGIISPILQGRENLFEHSSTKHKVRTYTPQASVTGAHPERPMRRIKPVFTICSESPQPSSSGLSRWKVSNRNSSTEES